MAEYTAELPQQAPNEELQNLLAKLLNKLDRDDILCLNRLLAHLVDSPGFSEAFHSFESEGGKKNLEREDYNRFMDEWEARTV